MSDAPKHPAPFSWSILNVMDGWIRMESFYTGKRQRRMRVLDPFAGIGRCHLLPGLTFGVEIEPEWAHRHPRTQVGSALALPWRANSFDVIATSPCLAQSHRVLTSDLRWVECGNLVEGDEVMAFDEVGAPNEARGSAARRRWRRATVLRSEPKTVECVRVILADGTEVLTTPEHPWLSQPYHYSSTRAEWFASRDLAGRWVMKQVEPWRERRSFDAGWLSGLFDGEGSLSLGQHGAPKMTVCQALGPVLDRAEVLMAKFGYEPNRIVRKGTPLHRQKVGNLYVTGGFPGMMRALGELRPMRLLDKWEQLDVSTRTIEAEKVKVLRVEPAGMTDIQEIETSEGTYFGEGYLMHNCYGNRFADSHNAQDGSTRRSYTHDLGRRLSPDSSGAMHWGPEYRKFHRAAWAEAARVLRPGGLFILNISDHIRAKQRAPVTVWHLECLEEFGFERFAQRDIPTSRMRKGQNFDARVEAEHVIALRVPQEVL